jgi:hypothetical protein
MEKSSPVTMAGVPVPEVDLRPVKRDVAGALK